MNISPIIEIASEEECTPEMVQSTKAWTDYQERRDREEAEKAARKAAQEAEAARRKEETERATLAELQAKYGKEG